MTASNVQEADVTLAVSEGPERPVALTPLVLAMPTKLAKLLDWDQKAPTTASLQALLTDPDGWRGYGHSEWGRVRIVSPDPATDAVGIAGYTGLATLAIGGPLTEAPNFGNPSAADLAVIKLEHAYAGLSADAVQKAMSATTVRGFTALGSMVVTTEREVLLHNESGALPLTAVYLPGDQGLVPVTATGPAEVVEGLTSKAGVAALRAAGWRTLTGERSDLGGSPVTITPATRSAADTAAAFASGRQLWSGTHTRTSTLALVDLSGSMQERFPGDPRSKLDVVRTMASRAFQVASPNARTGLWFFHTDGASKPLIEQARGLAFNRSDAGSVTHAQAVSRAIDRAWPSGDTPLYEAIRDAYAYATANYSRTMSNQLLVLSDGAEDSTSTVTLDDLLAYLEQAYDPERPVAIRCLLTDPGANLEELQAVAATTKGIAVPVSSVDEIPAAMTTTLFN